MASLYLQKLIPNDKRLHLPEIITLKKDLYIKIGEQEDSLIEDAILKLIYEKTGLLFLKYEYEFHPIIPKNLRGLHNLVSLLTPLNKDDLKTNFNLFLEYFYSDWIKNNLNLEEQSIINDFLKADIRQKNKLIINRLFNLIDNQSMEFIKKSKHLKNEISFEDEFNFVTNKLNNSINMSIGDVLFILKLINKLNDSYKNLVFAIKALYSITLYEVVSFEKNFEALQIILGGSFYNLDTLLIRKENNNVRRDFFEFSYKNLADSYNINKIVNDLRRLNFYDLNLEEFRLFELLQYFLLYLGVNGYNYREIESTPYYDKDPNLGRGNILLRVHTFDVLGFLFFVYNPKRILERIISDEDVLKNIFEENSEELNLEYKYMFLYNEIKEWRNKYYNIFPIYSIEFIEAILQYLSDTYDKQKKKATNSKQTKNKSKIGKLLDSVNTEQHESEDDENHEGNYYFYLRNFIDRMKDSIEKISTNNKYINNNVFKSFNNCPIVSIISNDKKDYKLFFENDSLVEQLFNDIRNPVKKLTTSLYDSNYNFKNIIIDKLNRSIRKAIRSLSQVKTIESIKSRIDNIIESFSDVTNLELINSLNFLKESIDEKNEFETGKSKTLEKVIELLEEELKKVENNG